MITVRGECEIILLWIFHFSTDRIGGFFFGEVVKRLIPLTLMRRISLQMLWMDISLVNQVSSELLDAFILFCFTFACNRNA